VIVTMAASVVLVVATILILYETLRLTSNHLADLPVPPRARIIAVVLAAFVGHTLAVWTYAFAYWVLAVRWQVGGFAGLPVEGFQDCLYFSVITYTTVGFGDQVPVSHARLIAGVEALNGLMLIGWSASFTYLAMERYWPMHAPRRGRAKRGGSGQTRPPPAASLSSGSE
jgi:Ion channel